MILDEYVYALIYNNAIFYIGRGRKNRMYKHEQDVRSGKIPNKNNTKLGSFIKDIIDRGDSITYYKVDENLNRFDACQLETALIKKYSYQLTNIASNPYNENKENSSNASAS